MSIYFQGFQRSRFRCCTCIPEFKGPTTFRESQPSDQSMMLFRSPSKIISNPFIFCTLASSLGSSLPLSAAFSLVTGNINIIIQWSNSGFSPSNYVEIQDLVFNPIVKYYGYDFLTMECYNGQVVREIEIPQQGGLPVGAHKEKRD